MSCNNGVHIHFKVAAFNGQLWNPVCIKSSHEVKIAVWSVFITQVWVEAEQWQKSRFVGVSVVFWGL